MYDNWCACMQNTSLVVINGSEETSHGSALVVDWLIWWWCLSVSIIHVDTTSICHPWWFYFKLEKLISWSRPCQGPCMLQSGIMDTLCVFVIDRLSVKLVPLFVLRFRTSSCVSGSLLRVKECGFVRQHGRGVRVISVRSVYVWSRLFCHREIGDKLSSSCICKLR